MFVLQKCNNAYPTCSAFICLPPISQQDFTAELVNRGSKTSGVWQWMTEHKGRFLVIHPNTELDTELDTVKEDSELRIGDMEFKPDYDLVILDESEHWSDGSMPELVDRCGAIRAVYVYDHNRSTYISSEQAHYWLMFVGFLTDNAISPEDFAELKIGFQEASGYQENDAYYPTNSIDSLTNYLVADCVPMNDDDTYEEVADAQREYHEFFNVDYEEWKEAVANFRQWLLTRQTRKEWEAAEEAREAA